MTDTLPSVLQAVDWQGNIRKAFQNVELLEKIESALMRIAQWAKQLETVDSGNPAISFVREAQQAAHQCSALIGLCLYKTAASSARTMVETILYYTYFRSHPTELSTLVRVKNYYITKSEVIEFHKLHTPMFTSFQEAFGLVGKLEKWYSEVSSIVHGQIPGAWSTNLSIGETSYSEDLHKLSVESFIAAEHIFHLILLCTCGKTMWSGFSPYSKTFLLKGIPGAKKSLLGLDSK